MVGHGHDGIALVMMGQDQDIRSKVTFASGDAGRDVLIGSVLELDGVFRGCFHGPSGAVSGQTAGQILLIWSTK